MFSTPGPASSRSTRLGLNDHSQVAIQSMIRRAVWRVHDANIATRHRRTSRGSPVVSTSVSPAREGEEHEGRFQ
jgi:hypothetical protein